MYIRNAEVFHLSIPLRRPVYTETGISHTQESLLVRLESENEVGWGEVTPPEVPGHDGVSFSETENLLRQWYIPRVHGMAFSTVENWDQILPLRGNLCARAAVEMALWDLYSREKNQPLHKSLGAGAVEMQLSTVHSQPVFSDPEEAFYPENVNGFLDELSQSWDSGVVHLELTSRPGWDIQMMNAVRNREPLRSFHVDFTGQLRPTQSEILFRAQDFFPLMVEQPYIPDELCASADLVEGGVMVCLEESIRSSAVLQTVARMRAAQCVKLDPQRMGGLQPVLDALRVCREENLSAWISGRLGVGIAQRHALALSCCEGVTGPFIWFAPEQYFSADFPVKPLSPEKDPKDGLLRLVPENTSGIGVDVRLA